MKSHPNNPEFLKDLFKKPIFLFLVKAIQGIDER